MDFETWYNSNVREEDVTIQHIVLEGRTMSHKACEEFWTAYKASLKKAYEDGQKNKVD